MNSIWDRGIGRQRAQGYEVVEAEICVIGVGTAGSAAVRSAMKEPVTGVRYVLLDADLSHVESSPKSPLWIKIGGQCYHDNGSHGDTVEVQRLLQQSPLKRLPGSPDMVLIAADLGDGVLTDAIAVVSHLSRDIGAQVVAFAALPHASEGRGRTEAAMASIDHLRSVADNVITICKECLVQCRSCECDCMPTVSEIASLTDEMLRQGIQSMCETVFVLGEVNVALAVVKKVMSLPGLAVMAMGEGAGNHPPVEAAQEALANPSAPVMMGEARGVLVNFCGGPDLTLSDVSEAATLIAAASHPGCVFAFGVSSIRERLRGRAQVTVIAAGIGSSQPPPPQADETFSQLRGR